MDNQNSNDSCDVFDEEDIGVEETKQEEVHEEKVEALPVKQSEEKNVVEVNAKEERAAQLAHARKKAAEVRREKYAQREQDRIERAAMAVVEKMMRKREREEQEENEHMQMKKQKSEAVAVKKKTNKTLPNNVPPVQTSYLSDSNSESSPVASPASSPERIFVSGKKLSKSEMLQYHIVPPTYRNPFL